MREDIKQAWADALRSGEYKQGVGWLNLDNSYCCLGVLCDVLDTKFPKVLIESGNVIAVDDGLMNIGAITRDRYFIQSSLPDSLMSHPAIDIQFTTHRIFINMNDIEKKSFVDIADYIEENL